MPSDVNQPVSLRDLRASAVQKSKFTTATQSPQSLRYTNRLTFFWSFRNDGNFTGALEHCEVDLIHMLEALVLAGTWSTSDSSTHALHAISRRFTVFDTCQAADFTSA